MNNKDEALIAESARIAGIDLRLRSIRARNKNLINGISASLDDINAIAKKINHPTYVASDFYDPSLNYEAILKYKYADAGMGSWSLDEQCGLETSMTRALEMEERIWKSLITSSNKLSHCRAELAGHLSLMPSPRILPDANRDSEPLPKINSVIREVARDIGGTTHLSSMNAISNKI